jgi:hypothetical protein
VLRSDLFARVLNDEYADYWPVERELLATIVDELSYLIHIFLRANGAKNVPEPYRVPRPEQTRLGRHIAEPDTRVADMGAGGNVISFSQFKRMLEEG